MNNARCTRPTYTIAYTIVTQPLFFVWCPPALSLPGEILWHTNRNNSSQIHRPVMNTGARLTSCYTVFQIDLMLCSLQYAVELIVSQAPLCFMLRGHCTPFVTDHSNPLDTTKHNSFLSSVSNDGRSQVPNTSISISVATTSSIPATLPVSAEGFEAALHPCSFNL